VLTQTEREIREKGERQENRGERENENEKERIWTIIKSRTAKPKLHAGHKNGQNLTLSAMNCKFDISQRT
jgi:hypothetical protein